MKKFTALLGIIIAVGLLAVSGPGLADGVPLSQDATIGFFACDSAIQMDCGLPVEFVAILMPSAVDTSIAIQAVVGSSSTVVVDVGFAAGCHPGIYASLWPPGGASALTACRSPTRFPKPS